MSKSQKLSRVDRISELPDSLLCHILSFIPSTKQVVATSILSRRWTTLWTYVPYLNFDSNDYSSDQDDGDDVDDDDDDEDVEDDDDHDHGHDDNEKRMSFTNFVYRVLTLLKTPTVETFRLQCQREIDPLQVNTWIWVALRRGVKELDLLYCGGNTIFQLPRSAFTCESLVVLKLNGSIRLSCPSYIHLPSLKILHLVELGDKDSVEKLISGCPILEDLNVMISLWRVTTFIISVPTLKRLRVRIQNAYPESKVQISTPSLDNLVILDLNPVDYLLEKLPNLVQADADISFNRNYVENYGDCVLKLLRGLYNVKILSFSYITCGYGINVSFDDPPLFPNLVNLKLGVDSFDCHVLKTLLEISPSLKVLDIYKTPSPRVTYEGHEFCWSQPSCVPECLSSHLETFKVRSFEGWEHDQLEFVKYILKNALVLVTITVYTSQGEKSNVIKKMSMFPRGSKTCQLEFP